MIHKLLAVSLLFSLAPVGAKNVPVEIDEWTVEWQNTRPRDPAVADDGRVWFVGQAGDYAAVFDPGDESFKRFDLPDGAGPHTIYITRDDQIWYTGNKARHLGRIDPDTGEIEQVAMPQRIPGSEHRILRKAHDTARRAQLWHPRQPAPLGIAVEARL